MDKSLCSKEDMGVLIGTLCGDCGRKGLRLYCGQSVKQKDWFDFKKKRFEKIFNQSFKEYKYDYPKYNTSVYQFITNTNDLTKYLINLFYPNDDKKIISKEALNQLTLEGVAWWYMDDGSMSIKKIDGKPRGAEITLNTYLTAEENQTIIDFFQNQYNITWKLNKSRGKYRLRMGKKEGKKFFALIEPYIIDSMKYKIDFSKS
jgi:hypothetical protein